MGIIQNALARIKDKKDRYKDAETEKKIQEKIEQRSKDADERELERYMEEKRKLLIRKELQKERQKKSNEIWTSNCFTNNRNMFNSPSIFNGNHGQRWF